jgi:hypothetical protein
MVVYAFFVQEVPQRILIDNSKPTLDGAVNEQPICVRIRIARRLPSEPATSQLAS